MSDGEVDDAHMTIGVEDSGEEKNDDSGGRGKGGGKQGNGAIAEEEQKRKPETKKKRPPFSETNLVSEKGLLKIYKEFPSKCKYKGKGHEAEFLRRVMFFYKEWGYQLYPALAFEDLAARIEKLGGKARVRQLLGELREQERDRHLEASLGQTAVQDVRAFEAAKATAKDAMRAEKRDEEELDNHRYAIGDSGRGTVSEAMDIDGGGQEVEGQHSFVVSADTASTSAAAALQSDKIRERMERNRRLAMERLQQKRDAASAAEVKTESGSLPDVTVTREGPTDDEDGEIYGHNGATICGGSSTDPPPPVAGKRTRDTGTTNDQPQELPAAPLGVEPQTATDEPGKAKPGY